MQQLLLYMPSFYGISIEVYFIVLLLAIPFFFAWRWLFRKILRSESVVAITAVLATVASAPIAYIVGVGIFFSLLLYHPNDEFDKERWHTDKEKRYELSEDIIKSELLIGKSKAEVKQLLGDDYDGTEDDWHYYLGFVPSIGGIDPDVLDIYFEGGKVVRVGQHET
jgi:hypothetical protein